LGLTRSHRQLHKTEHAVIRGFSVLFMAVDRVSCGGTSGARAKDSGKRFLCRQPFIRRFGHV
jgi:hypothetical protein